MGEFYRRYFCMLSNGRRLLAALLILLVGASTALADGEQTLTVFFLDVGQGDASLIICENETLMIDGGKPSDSRYVYSFLSHTMGFTHLDYMIATHPHQDHIGGLAAALNVCTVDTVFTPVMEYDTKQFASLVKYVSQQGADMIVPTAGDTFSLGSATVQFLSPETTYQSVNDMSIVVRIVFGETSFLFAGDAEWEPEHDMVDSGLQLASTVLKVGHHGSDTSSCYVFLREVMPEFAIISVGDNNSYGHPSEAVLSRLEDVGAEIYRTDRNGMIMCVSNGETITITTER